MSANGCAFQAQVPKTIDDILAEIDRRLLGLDQAKLVTSMFACVDGAEEIRRSMAGVENTLKSLREFVVQEETK